MLCRAELPTQEDAVAICAAAAHVLLREENVLALQAPISIVGDVHGQFFDLLHMFRLNGAVPSRRYLFLGDCVDRGAHGVETLLLLLCLKLRHPGHVFLLRGNHESFFLSRTYGFKDECWEKYSLFVYFKICDLFEMLPLAAVVNGDIFCVHGGLVQGLTLDMMARTSRLEDLPKLGGILWSDPSEETSTYAESPRGSGCLFGRLAAEEFLRANKMRFIVRSHQLVQAGHCVAFECVHTIWSAPNYCYAYENLASIMVVSEDGSFEILVYDKCENQLGPA
ncbi:UNVERIFIED_CONTAM: hypothetical protein PYX00_010900 [Menopon gallinae]|uniref:Serine/threonine-protein phosphatase n=1 Tax=Menopon gallinae TaxID=328185 RepID=A0AAW2H6D8_9NEOP